MKTVRRIYEALLRLFQSSNSLSSEDRVWVAILLQDEHADRLPEDDARVELAACGFPPRIIEAYLQARR